MTLRKFSLVLVLMMGMLSAVGGREENARVRRCKKKAAEKMKLAYLLLAHDSATLRATARLMDAIYEESNWYWLHIDAKYAPFERSLVEAIRRNRTNVEWGQIFDVQWARWSMIEPTLWAMEKALGRDWEYFINLSGDAWPVLTPMALKGALGALSPLNFVASAPQSPTGLRPTARSEFGDGWHKKQAYPSPMVEAIPTMEAHYGSQWMLLHRNFVNLVIEQLSDPKAPGSVLRDWFKYAMIHVDGVGKVRPHIPDETFFPTLLMFSNNQTAPYPIEIYESCYSGGDTKKKLLKTAFFIRMDEHYPWSSSKQRYVAPALDKKARPWGPYYLGAYDLKDIRDFGAFFIRKVSDDVDPTLFSVLPVDDHDMIPPIAWPPHGNLALSEKDPRFETVTRGKDQGCIRVAESIHCPPNHNLKPDVAQADIAAAFLTSASSSGGDCDESRPPTTFDEDDEEL